MRWDICRTHTFIADSMNLATRVALPLIALLGVSLSSAEGREPPFEAVIGANEAFVRSGAGDDTYYPTSKLEKGARVKVVREDFGGWFLIEPPEGSHSWIPQKFVEKRAGNRAVVTTSTFDRIGSDIPQQRLDARHRILRGETVEILGEEELATEHGPEKMFKIRPPRGEYRYINKRDVVPSDDGAESDFKSPMSLDGDAFADTKKPDGATESKQDSKAPSLPSRADEGVPTPKVEEQTTKATETAKTVDPEVMEPLPPGTINAFERLAQVDRDFRDMVTQPVESWNLEAIRHEYAELRDAPQLSDASFQREVNRRMTALGRYEKNYADYLDLVQIMKQTEARDEQLRQQFLVQREVVSTSQTPTTRVYRDVSKPTQQPLPTTTAQQPRWTSPPQNQLQTQPQSQPQPTPGQWQRSVGPQATLPTTPFGANPNVPRKFDGAGIIQRSALNRPDFPKHVLVAPDGGVLTYLQPGQGINLDRHLGQSMGFMGQRSFRQDLNADLLVVNRMQPVQLRQP